MVLPPTLVFDYPSSAAIAAFITATVTPPGLEDEEGRAAAAAAPQLGAPMAAPAARAAAAAAATVVAVTTFSARTGGGDAVMSLAGVDATQRVPWARWVVDDQDKVLPGNWEPEPGIRPSGCCAGATHQAVELCAGLGPAPGIRL